MSTSTNNDTATTPMITTEEYFGGCPACGKNNGYLNIGRSHWFVCDDHRVLWCAGANLFSSWQDATQAEQEANYKRIESYVEVKPIYPDPRDAHMETVVWHRVEAKHHTDMAEKLEQEHGFDPLEVAKKVEAEFELRRVAKTNAAALADDDIPW